MGKKSQSSEQSVAEALKARIFSEVEAGSGRLPPLRAMSKSLGVTDAIVRKALRQLAEGGLITMRQGSGTYISSALQQASRTVAVVYRIASEASIRSPWHAGLLRDIGVQLERSGWIARNYTLSHGTEIRDERAMDQLIADAQNRMFSGLIILSEFSKLRDGFRELLDEQNIKYLTTDYSADSNAVIPDYFQFGRQAAQHLYEKGVRRMGMIGIRNIHGKPLGEDIAGMKAFAAAHPDVEIRPEWSMLVVPSVGTGYDSFERIWSLPERPQGLVVTDDVMFLGVAMVMNKLKVVPPHDLHLVAHGTQGVMERSGVIAPRISFSTQSNASLLVAQLQAMIRDEVSTVPVTRVGGMLSLDEESLMEKAGAELSIVAD